MYRSTIGPKHLSEHCRKCSDSRRRLCRGSQLSELSDSHYRTIEEATIGLSERLLSDYRRGYYRTIGAIGVLSEFTIGLSDQGSTLLMGTSLYVSDHCMC